MKIQIVPAPDMVFSELAPILPTIYTAVDLGAQHVQEYRDWQQLPIDAVLAPGLLRSRAKRYLVAVGNDVADLDREDIPNNGLLLNFNRYGISILKSENGQLPPPGRSDRKQAFYDQRHLTDPQQPVLPFPNAELVLPDRLNVVITWSVTANYVLTGLTLSVPRYGALSQASVEVFWSRPMPPLELQQTPPPADPPSPSDLPMTLVTSVQQTG